MARPPVTLEARIRAWIDALEPGDALGAWPLRLGKERGLLLIHGNQAFLWYLAPDGRVFVLDTDDVARRFEPETDPAAARAALEAAVNGAYPQLRALLGPQAHDGTGPRV